MLKELSIRNYAIIDSLDIEFSRGLNIITGETGAGKSILLGALSLVAGSRVDASVISKGDENCVAEAVFDISGYDLQEFFTLNDLEYNQTVTVRRVIAPTGRSRAFIDDSPVTLNVLRDLSTRLIDIHSQHQTLLLSDNHFQTNVIDAVAQNGALVAQYSTIYNSIKECSRRLKQLREESAESSRRKDYLTFQVEQIEQLQIKPGEIEELEAEADILTHATEIAESLNQCATILDADEVGVVQLLRNILSTLSRTSSKHSASGELRDRVESTYLELRDIAQQSITELERIEINPSRLAMVQERLDALNSLCHKHAVETTSELLELNMAMENELLQISSSEDDIIELEKQEKELTAKAFDMASKLSLARSKVVPMIEKHIREMLSSLGILNAKMVVQITDTKQLLASGTDHIEMLFSANASSAPQRIDSVASGGEMSRLMLAIKSLVSQKMKLPTVIFDEIDTGVSGAVADKMGQIIMEMGAQMQVLNITHLPQVAAKGQNHYLVYKDKGTHIRKLSDAERIEHIAMMLSGAAVTDAAREQAKVLINN